MKRNQDGRGGTSRRRKVRRRGCHHILTAFPCRNETVLAGQGFFQKWCRLPPGFHLLHPLCRSSLINGLFLESSFNYLNHCFIPNPKTGTLPILVYFIRYIFGLFLLLWSI